MAFGGPLEGPPELQHALKCEIKVPTNNVAIGSRITIFVTVENTATVDAQLPCPGTHEDGLHTRILLLAGQTTGVVQRLSIPNFVFRGNLTGEQGKMLEQPTDRWGYIYVPARWIAIPAQGREQFQALVEISPKTGEGGAVALAPGAYGLQCEIEYVMWHGSDAFLETNQWTAADRIAKAKASGVFLLDRSRLWTGKMESNIVDLTITNQAAPSNTDSHQ
jgi:hypothetical protein